jgi:hypothetical protein
MQEDINYFVLYSWSIATNDAQGLMDSSRIGDRFELDIELQKQKNKNLSNLTWILAPESKTKQGAVWVSVNFLYFF